MVQIIEGNPNKWARLGAGIGSGFSRGISERLSGIQEEKLQKRKLENEFAANQQGYDILKNNFGEKFADIWRASPQGARTELTKAALDARARGIDLEKMLEGTSTGDLLDQSQQAAESSIGDNRRRESEYKLDTSGLNAKDIVSYKSALRKENSPIYTENKDRQKNYNELRRDIKILDALNEKKNLPEGFGKLLINPETGTPYETLTAIKKPHKDVQQWVKTIARQATLAQKAFPGRVTNFDLTQYMRQFPGLFNTYEGRKVILQQMDLVNQANKLLADAMDKVYIKHKLSGITPEDAYTIAEESVKGTIQEIDEKLLSLAEEGEILSEVPEKVSSEKSRVSVYDEKGNEVGDIDISEVEQLPPGYRIR
jgi:hypothetical protein